MLSPECEDLTKTLPAQEHGRKLQELDTSVTQPSNTLSCPASSLHWCCPSVGVGALTQMLQGGEVI